MTSRYVFESPAILSLIYRSAVDANMNRPPDFFFSPGALHLHNLTVTDRILCILLEAHGEQIVQYRY